MPRLLDESGIWDVGRADPSVHEQTTSDVPVLVMNGNRRDDVDAGCVKSIQMPTFNHVELHYEVTVAVRALSYRANETGNHWTLVSQFGRTYTPVNFATMTLQLRYTDRTT